MLFAGPQMQVIRNNQRPDAEDPQQLGPEGGNYLNQMMRGSTERAPALNLRSPITPPAGERYR